MNSEAIDSLIKKNPMLAAKREQLEKFVDGAYCMHSSWGLGCIKSYDASANRLVIDFEGKPNHSMDPAFCVNKLDVLDNEDILVRYKKNPDEIEKLMKDDPAKFVESILERMTDKTATSVELENILVRLFASEKEFRSWWNKAKKALVRDPKVACPKTKNDHYVLRNEEDEKKPERELLEEYFLNRDAKKKILLAEKLYNMVASSGDEKESIKSIEEDLPKIKDELTNAIKTARTLTQADKLHGIWVRNDLVRYLYPENEDEVEQLSPRSRDIISASIEADNKYGLSELAKNLPSSYYARFLDLLVRIYKENGEWREMLLELLKNSEGRFTNECANFFIDWEGQSKFVKGEEGRIEPKEVAVTCKQLVKESLHRWLDEQTLRGPVILWVVKNRNAAKFENILKDLIGQRLFTALLSAIDDEALQSDSNRRIALVDTLSDDKHLVADLLKGASSETARDLAQSLLLNQGFDDLTQKSILARFIKLYPDVQTLVAGRGETKVERLYVSKESLEVRRIELEDIIKNQLPASKKAIEAARELGDLKENSEYKMAREHDEVLTARRAQLEREISSAEVVDFSQAPTDVVGIGSVVVVEKDGKEKEKCYIRGAWDSNPDKNIYSYKTPLAQALLEHKVGDVVETNIEGHKTSWKIISIAVEA